jgi:chorismate mutase/prephenate dehydratase
MKSLTELREQIDRLDDKLLRLLNERAKVALEVGKAKAAAELPVYVPEREASLLRRLAELNPGPLPPASLLAIYREIISASRSLEHPQPVLCLQDELNTSWWVAHDRLGSSLLYTHCPSISEGLEQINNRTASCLVLHHPAWLVFSQDNPSEAASCRVLMEWPETPTPAGPAHYLALGPCPTP